MSDIKASSTNLDRVNASSGKKAVYQVPYIRNFTSPFSHLSQMSVFQVDLNKYKKIYLMRLHLEKQRKLAQLSFLQEAFEKLKKQWSDVMIKKVGLAKLGRVVRKVKFKNCQEFFSLFVDEFQSHKQKLLKQGSLMKARRRPSSGSASKQQDSINLSQEAKQQQTQLSLQNFPKLIKTYKDLLSQPSNNNPIGERENHKTISSDTLKIIIKFKDMCNRLSLLFQNKSTQNQLAAFQSLQKALFKNIKDDEELSQLRDFTNLLDKSNDLGEFLKQKYKIVKFIIT
jgi:hypothetical protein